MKIIRRDLLHEFAIDDHHPVLSDVLQKRKIYTEEELTLDLKTLLPAIGLSNINEAAELIIAALIDQKKILIVGDYDVDGATAIALAIRILRVFGAKNLHYIVPNRMEDGYGLTEILAHRIIKNPPDLLITVDNGISSVEGVAIAKAQGICVLITDHHLPPQILPNADAIVNPNLENDLFESKALSGVGVIFYLLIHVRTLLIEQGYFKSENIPNLAQYLDLVALGTVADVVPLDANNRRLVQQGLLRIRQECTIAGIKALAFVSKKSLWALSTSDIGFGLAPLLNAAGRLDDMALGIECLLTDDDAHALQYAVRLYELNQERRAIERSMVSEADLIMARLVLNENDLPCGLCLYDEGWHQGVMGIVASRLKETFFRPVIIFADDNDEYIKGSGRSIPGIHLRDLLDLIAKKTPNLIDKFGGHAMAAGLSIKKEDFKQFRQLFDEAVNDHLEADTLKQVVYSDGALDTAYYTTDIAAVLMTAMPWGQHFAEPMFDDHFEVIEFRILQQEHIKFRLRLPNSDQMVEAIAFFQAKKWEPETENIHCVFKLSINEWAGKRSLQLLVDHFFAV